MINQQPSIPRYVNAIITQNGQSVTVRLRSWTPSSWGTPVDVDFIGHAGKPAIIKRIDPSDEEALRERIEWARETLKGPWWPMRTAPFIAAVERGDKVMIALRWSGEAS